ncbi:alpha-L-fucosidase [Luteibacter rhizovicinus]|uniref:alpha-L-fucosidase n=1 Tax=Luteibacter rhizovicinus TaxID=242606 RepID=A0A4R3YMS8_9GAMM|nr:alpha-L-fucosidase [Luteibacter rhizovicinus]TCV93937.1 alpha-L-fucosidase [Luteibacter rhizovicinus]
MNRREFSKALAFAGGIAATVPLVAKPFAPYTASGTAVEGGDRLLRAQQAFLDLRFGMFIHLNMATFEEREWGDPTLSPHLFNPAHLDTDQWARAARSANMGYGCLSTKHHDGFCLWPTKTGSANVMDSSYRHDIVRAYVDSFRAQGLKPCLYFSMLDLRADIRARTVTPAKIALIEAQLTELLTQYGPITAMIFDGWNASWSRIGYDQLPYRRIYDLVKRLQPDCLVTDHNAGSYPGPALYYTDIKQYEQHAGQKIPADSDVPSQSGTTLQSDWFWKTAYPNQELRAARQIVDEWLVPFNRNHCNLILNVAPNRDGQFDPNAIERLAEIGKLWKNEGPAPTIHASTIVTTPNLAAGKPAYASSSADATGPDLAFDDRFGTFWVADEGKTTAWLEVRLGKPTAFNTLSIVESKSLEDYGTASRIASYRAEYQRNGQWKELVSGEHPAPFQFHTFGRVEAESVRIQLTSTGKPPGLAELGLYDEPA